MSVNPIEQVALDAIEFIEDLTADPLLDSEDVEMSLEDAQAHACIEAASLRKRLAAALEAEASKIERNREDERDRLYEKAAAETTDKTAMGKKAFCAAVWLSIQDAMAFADRARARQGGNNG